eukprot:CAMPEP_0197843580 /NCGR_PEP_ID=MMETSP1438-20131217/454_1 /TAXON_ID=1461541 /ORGANISM="Pterosperma sp., Strain CCMP1384" /LENGTH=270 /DNA_ID=CAMNT_0043453795 /DNA_START=280 /DNA_END=1092 /DNA_ORIENTATION=+
MDEYKQDTEKALLDVLSSEELLELVDDYGNKISKAKKEVVDESEEKLPAGLVSPSLKLQHQLDGTWGEFKKEAIQELRDALIADRDKQMMAKQKEIESLQEERDAAIAELGNTFSQMTLLEAALEDAVIHAEELRSKSKISQLTIELEAEKQKSAELAAKLNTRDGEVRQLIEVLSEDQKPKPEAKPAESEVDLQRRAFSLARTASSIQSAIEDAFKLDEDQRRTKIEALKTRWDPDKNPILTELSAEVTKIINHTVEKMQSNGGSEKPA